MSYDLWLIVSPALKKSLVAGRRYLLKALLRAVFIAPGVISFFQQYRFYYKS